MTKHKITWIISALITALLSGVLFVMLVPSLWRQVTYVFNCVDWDRYWHISTLFSLFLPMLAVLISGIFSLGAIGSVVIKKGKPSTFMAVSFLMQSVFWFSGISGSAMGYDFMLTLVFFFIGLTALSLLLMATVCYAGENGGKLTKYRFVPAIVFAVAIALMLVVVMFVAVGEAIDDFEYFFSEIVRNLLPFICVMLGFAAYIAALVLAGISLGDKKVDIEKAVSEAKKKVASVKVAAPVKAAPVKVAPKAEAPKQTDTALVADDLRKYKQLYDEGVITEEEFAQKKKQIMEL